MKVTHERDMALEGLRGLCAVLVVVGHMTYQAPLLDPGFACDRLHVDYGPQAVFVFFVLSGYVIGLTTRVPATGASIRNYCSRRLLRIVPIAWIAILFTWVVLRHNGPGTVLGNMLFLQNNQPYPLGLRIPVLYDNPPLWSLSFEMLFYGLFVLIWKFRPSVRVLLPVLALVSLGDFVGLPAIFAHQAAYFAYWLSGLWIAWGTEIPGSEVRSAWPAAVGAAFVSWKVEPIHAILEAASGRLAALDSDRFHLDVFIGSVLVVIAATRRAPKIERRLTIAIVALGLTALPIKYLVSSLSYVDFAGGAVLCACFLARNWRPAPGPLTALAPVGVVSYALYATAYPLMRLVYRCPYLPSGSLATFLLRSVILVVLCAGSAVFLERFMQPRFVRWMGSSFGLRTVDLPHASGHETKRS